MKVFIIFFAMLMINVSFLSFNSDMDRYVKLQTHLKALAEESAAGASLFYDREAYSQGVIRINQNSANAYIEFLLGKAKEHYSVFMEGNITIKTIYFDDLNGLCKFSKV